MEYFPGLDEAKKRADEGYTVMPVSLNMLSDFCTPIEAVRVLKAASDYVFLLESVGGDERWGRYTFLGFEPSLGVACFNAEMTIGDNTFKTESPAAALREILARCRAPRFAALPPFAGYGEATEAARYRSIAADPATIPACLKVTARIDDGEVMAAMHDEKPIFGLQFHPESILTPLGKRMISNFVGLSRKEH